MGETGWIAADEQIKTDMEAWHQPACLEFVGTDEIRGFQYPDVGQEQEQADDNSLGSVIKASGWRWGGRRCVGLILGATERVNDQLNHRNIYSGKRSLESGRGGGLREMGSPKNLKKHPLR